MVCLGTNAGGTIGATEQVCTVDYRLLMELGLDVTGSPGHVGASIVLGLN